MPHRVRQPSGLARLRDCCSGSQARPTGLNWTCCFRVLHPAHQTSGSGTPPDCCLTSRRVATSLSLHQVCLETCLAKQMTVCRRLVGALGALSAYQGPKVRCFRRAGSCNSGRIAAPHLHQLCEEGGPMDRKNRTDKNLSPAKRLRLLAHNLLHSRPPRHPTQLPQQFHRPNHQTRFQVAHQ